MPTPITASTLSALLSAALAQKPTRPLVLALDGRCGSGKTTLANALAAQLPTAPCCARMISTCRPPGAARTGRTPPAPTWTLPACGTKPCALPTRGSP